MNSNRLSLLFILIINFSLLCYGQDNKINYNLKKGEAFDILLLTTKKGSKDTFKEYREKAFPVAAEMGYTPLPGFSIAETTQGNYEPKGMIFGKWTSLAMREKFLDEIVGRVPNFHEMRKKIWSLFSVTYYEVQKDHSLQLEIDKTIVATAFWKKDNATSKFDSLIGEWKEAVKKTNGTLKIELANSKSPKGYTYNPDYMVISQWDNQEDFDTFKKKNLKMDVDFLKNMNQFLLKK
ncbi:MAG: hypothetical protein AAGA43_04415 [Bacteroidota bacterium]